MLGLACGAGVLLVAWGAASGPVGVQETSGPPASYVVPPPSQTAQSPRPSASPSPIPANLKTTSRGPDLSWIRYVVLGLVVAGGVLLIVRSIPRLTRMWRELPDTDPRDERADVEVIPGADELAEALTADRARQLAAVDLGTPRNGIVEAWSRLEETAAGCGLPRKGWETSAEFTVRMLKGLDVDPLAAGELAELYRLARFSSHDVDEQQRDRARTALGRLHDDVRQLR